MIPSLLEAALRSVLVAIAVWAGLRALHVRNVLAQKTVWGLVLAVAAFMPMLLPVVARWPLGAAIVLPASQWMSWMTAPKPAENFTAKMAATSPQKAKPSAKPSPLPHDSYTSENLASAGDRFPAPTISNFNAVPAEVTAPPRAASRAPKLSFIQLTGLAYGAIASALLLRLLFGLAVALRLLRSAIPANVDVPAHLANGLILRSSSAVSSPVTIGSAVVLPEDYATWDSEKLRIVLAHERSHIQQRDFYLQMIASLYASLFWFSPLGWWLKRKLSELAEAISDRAGLEQAASRSSYAQVLLEFAAAPRPTLIGVAMARTSGLSRRIERLLNDSSFRQAFAGTRRRALFAVLLVPVAFFAATALIRVEAASQEPQPPAPPQSAPAAQPAPPASGVSTPDLPTPPASPALAAPAPAPNPEAAQQPQSESSVVPDVFNSPQVIVVPQFAPVAPEPPMPPIIVLDSPGDTARSFLLARARQDSDGKGYSYGYSSDGESFAIVRGDGKNIRFSGEWIDGRPEELDKARKMAHGDFLWFTHNGKSYVIDDPATVAQVEAMYKPMESLGKQQEALGREQEALGKQQEALHHLQVQVKVTVPDMSKEIAAIEAATAKLKAEQGKEISQEQIAEIQAKVGELQARMAESEAKVFSHQDEWSAMGKLGALQGELGSKQGALGAQQGKLAQEIDQKVKSIIAQALRNASARPVQ
jgi:beta-lactamase regulating signal transducer with metallopeptidase domain